MKIFRLTLIALTFGLAASAAQASTLDGWRFDANIVYEPIHTLGWKTTYADLENGNCALVAKVNAAGGAVTVTLINTTAEGAVAPCKADGVVHGTYACENGRSREAKALGNSSLCSREHGINVVEQIYVDGLKSNLRIIQRNRVTKENKYLNLHDSRRSI